MSAPRPLRVDAERNRQRLLEVAETVFANEGLDVPIDEIARRAGLGIGTLYRHFPTKEALFAAIVIGRLERVIEDAKARLLAPDADEAFFGFVAFLVAESSKKKDFLHALATSGYDVRRAMGDTKAELGRVTGKLLKRAQDAGAVRKDVDQKKSSLWSTARRPPSSASGRRPGGSSAWSAFSATGFGGGRKSKPRRRLPSGPSDWV
jgi:AcrR family transcriptional regulator